MNIHRHSRYRRDIHITCTDTHTTHIYIQRYIKDTRTYIAYTQMHMDRQNSYMNTDTHITHSKNHTHMQSYTNTHKYITLDTYHIQIYPHIVHTETHRDTTQAHTLNT